MGRPGYTPALTPLPTIHGYLPTIHGYSVNKHHYIVGIDPRQGHCPPGFTWVHTGCQETATLERYRAEFFSNKADSFLQTALHVGTIFAGGVATIASLGTLGPAFSTFTGGLKAVATTGLKVVSTLNAVATPAPTGGSMALNLGGILGAVGGLFGQASGIPILQTVGNLATAFAPAFSAAQPAMIAGPVYSPPPMSPQPMGQPVMAGGAVIAAGAGAVARMTAPILFRIASKLGRRVSLQGAITMIRKMGKFLMDPASIALALGITIAELATLITAHSSKKSRHMNAANGKALRRAARRIKSFHRMCGTIDLLKSRGRRTSVSRACGTCRKSPCRC